MSAEFVKIEETQQSKTSVVEPSPGSYDQDETTAPEVTNDSAASLSPETSLDTLLREVGQLRQKLTDLERKIEESNRAPEESTDDEITESDFDYKSDDSRASRRKIKTWKTWKLRRDVAKVITRKVNRIQRQRKTGRGGDSSSDESEDVPQEVLIPPVILGLNKSSWQDFRHPLSSGSPAHVIDVLLGKPVNTFRGVASVSKKSMMEYDVLGSQPLPDRIRINSRLLLSKLGRLHFINTDMNEMPSVVMLSPYKLIYHKRKEIRSWYEKLVVTHQQPEDGKEIVDQDTAESTQSNSTHTGDAIAVPLNNRETTHGDAESSDDHRGTDIAELEHRFPNPVAALDSKLALQHAQVLLQFVDDYVLARQAFLQSTACKKVTFKDLWLLFQPGVEVIDSDGDQAYRFHRIQTAIHQAVPSWSGFDTAPSAPPPSRGGHQPKVVAPIVGEQQAPPYSAVYLGDDKPFRIYCVYIDSDGFNLGPVTMIFEVGAFEGEKAITDLPVYPLHCRTVPLRINPVNSNVSVGSVMSLRDELVERGKKFIQMNLTRHVYYAGPTFDREIVDGQVILDNYQVYHLDKIKQAPALDRWVNISEPPPSYLSEACRFACCNLEPALDEQDVDKRLENLFLDTLLPPERHQGPSVAAMERPIADLLKSSDAMGLTDDEYLIMSNRVYGFILQTRKWAEMNLMYISEVEYKKRKALEPSDNPSTGGMKTALEELVLPAGHKDVIVSLVAQHFRDQGQHEIDLFRGKGKGLIILLHGAPGVGKTSTAEGVAEAFKKPLLQITCGDLGSTAKEVEDSLGRNFALASRWGCVLLLDEADVFLASRSRAVSGVDFNRNALVAVFLRVLEYYTGILFLTTNRVGDFDEAFASRIHISLEYPPLDFNSTKQVLALNLKLIGKRFEDVDRSVEVDQVGIGDSVLNYWRKHEKARLNGRQIRNACHTAIALAEFEAQGGSHEAVIAPNAIIKLQATHFDIVLKAYLEFNRYLKDIYGISSEEHAGELGLRAREKTPRKSKPDHSPGSNGVTSTGVFPGAHLYPPHPQMQARPMQAYPQDMYQSYTGHQQGYPASSQNQQGFPLTLPGSNSALPAYGNPVFRNNQQLQGGAHQAAHQTNDDTGAGHNIQLQEQPFGSSLGQPSSQPNLGSQY